MDHCQVAVGFQGRDERATPSGFQLSELLLRFPFLLVLCLTALINGLILSSPFSLKPSSFSLPLNVTPAYAGDVRYVYDDLGRLSAVVDLTTNEAAIYQYDAVGNLLGIVRQPASTVSILNFTPKSGPIGTAVTISGTGYSPTASQNTVSFNGTPASVSSATATQLVVTVPTGATTGPIAVTTQRGGALRRGGVSPAPGCRMLLTPRIMTPPTSNWYWGIRVQRLTTTATSPR